VSFRAEIKAFLAAYPQTEVIDLLIADISGIFRGKQVAVDALDTIAAQGAYFPISTPFLMTNGANAERTYDAYGSDPDRACLPVEGSLKPVPWASKPTAQLLLQMQAKEGGPIFSDPRSVLAKVLACYDEDQLTPVAALEYEFFLFKAETLPPQAIAPPSGMPEAPGANCFNMEILQDYEPLLQQIQDACLIQGININGLVCEYGRGQFEVNIAHSNNIVKMCDDALLLKRVVRAVAVKNGLLASFMAKPIMDEVGSGLHAHVSILDQHGSNVFAEDKDKLLHSAIGGLLHTMREATAFFAPNANSYRRFDPEWFAPVVPNWGENNRRLSIRLPLSDTLNRRLEHRVSGADASPHLSMAAILAGVHYGMKNHCDPGPELGEFDLVNYDKILPDRWKISLHALDESFVLRDYFSKEFIDLYLDVRFSEEDNYHRATISGDHDQYLRVL
jgi:glutamine synthetase